MAAQWYPPVMDSAAQENSESRLGHPPGSTASYAYDAFGRRAEKIVGSRTTDYLYDAFGHDSYEVNNLCAPVCIDTGFFYLGGQLVAEYKEGLTYFVHTDHIGSTRLVTGLNQTVVQNLDYLPFGEQNSTDSGISTHEFTGDVHDAESNLDHAQFRQYSSTLARWMHPDPAGLAAVDSTNPQSWNRYAYVDDDPLNLTDSSGLYPVCLGSSLFDQVDFYVDEKYQGSDLTYIGNLCGDQGQRLPPDRSALLIHGGGGGGSGRGGGNSSGGGSILDDRANALANALNKTGVQSLGNPCTVGAFYLASAVGGAATSGEVYAQGAEAATTYWPQALSQVSNWLYRQALRGGPVANFIVNIPKNYNKAKAAVLGGCNGAKNKTK